MFNLLVQYQAWADGRDTMLASRVLEWTEQSLLDRFQPGGKLNLESLLAFPALFVQETYGEQAQVARVGTITRARNAGRDIVLDYNYDLAIPPIPNSVLKEFAIDLDIRDGEFSRTHWPVKESDLYRALIRISSPRRQRPKVFRLAEFENIEPSLVSAMMPFHPHFDAVYATLKRTAEEAGLRCRRADDIWENPAVMQDVVSLIDRSRIIICDSTGRNPNVFYETGIAHALGREVILITQNEADIPFDLRHLRYVSYLNNGEGLSSLSARPAPRLAELAAAT
jgi:hypothetical protein